MMLHTMNDSDLCKYVFCVHNDVCVEYTAYTEDTILYNDYSCICMAFL